MRRRDFLTFGIAAAAAWPLAALAQQNSKRIGILIIGSAVAPKELAFVSELTKLGYVEGNNARYDVRGADGDIARLTTLARELVLSKPDVLIGASEAVAAALADATAEIPIIITVMGDPIAIGLTNSLSHPSRNVTGFTQSSSTLTAKRLELLRELIPTLRRLAYLNAPGPMIGIFEQQVRNAASVLGITVTTIPVTTEASVSKGFELADREQIQAVMVETSATSVRLSAHIIDECLVRDLPAIHPWSSSVRDGALMSYGPATVENNSGAASYVDRILKGAKVVELPIQEPTDVKLAINLHTARAIGLTIPPAFLARADEVIE
jgi:putative ABC transport system substrate-binding protein